MKPKHFSLSQHSMDLMRQILDGVGPNYAINPHDSIKFWKRTLPGSYLNARFIQIAVRYHFRWGEIIPDLFLEKFGSQSSDALSPEMCRLMLGVLINVAGHECNDHILFNQFAQSLLQDGFVDIRTLSFPPKWQYSPDSQSGGNWDFFISHASEDKEAIARPLAEALRRKGKKVWYDDFSLKMGASLRESIDHGLAHSSFGIVILSPHFFHKHWPKQELDGLVAREVNGTRVILPIWHGVGFKEVREESPTLADRIAVTTDKGLDVVVEKILNAASPLLLAPKSVRRRLK